MILTMRTSPVSPIAALGWPAWIATLAGFAMLCAIVSWWALRLAAPRAVTAPAVDAVPTEAAGPGRAIALFGASSAAAAPASGNIAVIGVLSGGPRGSAILSIDGRPGRAFAVGEAIDASTSLTLVEPDRVVITSGGRRTELRPPARPDPRILVGTPQR